MIPKQNQLEKAELELKSEDEKIKPLLTQEKKVDVDEKK